MQERFHRPALFTDSAFETFQGGEDPAQISRIAHDTASALLSRVRNDPDPEVLDRLITYTDGHGIDAIAELWSRAAPHSLPGALWRIYLLRVVIRQAPELAGIVFTTGAESSATIDPVLAGAATPTGPDEISALADTILRGVFEGDFAVALERAAAFCRIMAHGYTKMADDDEAVHPERATGYTARALRFSTTGTELVSCARLWRADSLD